VVWEKDQKKKYKRRKGSWWRSVKEKEMMRGCKSAADVTPIIELGWNPAGRVAYLHVDIRETTTSTEQMFLF
jgi:hypothetical protein